MSKTLLGGHPDTCDLAAARGAVVEMHVVMVPGAHERMKGSRDGGASQLQPLFMIERWRRVGDKDCISGRL